MTDEVKRYVDKRLTCKEIKQANDNGMVSEYLINLKHDVINKFNLYEKEIKELCDYIDIDTIDVPVI